MKYVATQKGFFNDRLINAGEVFEADDFNGKWAVEKGKVVPKVEKSDEQLVAEAKEGLQGRRKKKKKVSKKKD